MLQNLFLTPAQQQIVKMNPYFRPRMVPEDPLPSLGLMDLSTKTMNAKLRAGQRSMIGIPYDDFSREETTANIGTCRGVGELKEIDADQKNKKFMFKFTVDSKPTKKSCDATFTHKINGKDTGKKQILHVQLP